MREEINNTYSMCVRYFHFVTINSNLICHLMLVASKLTPHLVYT